MKNVSCVLLLVTLAFASLSAVSARTSDEWRSRTIYQLLTDRFSRGNGDNSPCGDLGVYCGGTFKGITQNLDYIKGMGFDAIWISPIVENIGQNYHGYAASNWYVINPHFGTEQDFINLISACHSKDIWMMVDVVANHVGPVDLDFSQIYPFNKSEHYHEKCQIEDSDWQNNQARVEYCRLANLPDLDQDNSFVRTTLKNWVHDLVQKYNIDGLRIDTIPEVGKDFWSEYNAAAGVYTVGEVFDGRIDFVASYQGYIDATLQYPLYFTIKDVFAYSNSMYSIRNTFYYSNAFPNQNILGVFADNHDNPRFLYLNNDVRKLKSAVAFTLFSKGIPIFYYGDEQGYAGGYDPNCREPLWTNMNTNSDLYNYVKALVGWRKQYQVWNEEHIERWCDDTFYAFTRGNVLISLTNSLDRQERYITYIPYSNGQKVCNLLYSGDCVTVQNGQLQSVLLNGEVKIYVPVNSNDEPIFLEA